MSISLHELVNYTDNFLQVQRFKDYCPNGLQVEASQTLSKIITGVTASQALIDRAIAEKADAILVHHGYFWTGEAAPLTGIKGKRIASLIRNHISLIAYHLPLDAHPVVGNNAQLAKVLGFDVLAGLDDSENPIGLVGELPQALPLAALAARIEQRLQRTPLFFGAQDKPIKRVAWCTGAAQSYMQKAIDKGVDCFITGEVSEQTYHLATESGVSFIAAGHHATERYGVKALGEHLAERFAVGVVFVDLDNPV